jgi:2-(1,2-epoxy-1,2-dihydrophenyl)acetyl-CoA isomerase
MTDWEALPSPSSLALGRIGNARRIEFNRPDSLNAFDSAMATEFLAVLGDLAADDGVRSILLTGAGRAFSAGADIKSQFGTDEAKDVVEQELREISNPTVTLLREMGKPVIAAVNGAAAGIGCSMALAADLVLASEKAFFLLAFANIGLAPDGGSSLLVPARVGLGRAFVMALLAERIPAAEALAWGLADRVLPADELAGAATELAVRLSNGPTRSYAASKQAINAAQLAGLAATLDREARLQGELVRSDDFAEGAAAFTAKRAPEFTGR